MLSISNTKVYDLEESIIASGYPMMIHQLSEEEFSKRVEHNSTTKNNDHERIKLLAKTPMGSGHSNALKGVRVSFDIRYPQYFSMELQRYNFVDIVSSSSKMHRLVKMDMDLACNEHVTQETKDNMRAYIKEYNEKKDHDSFMRVLSNCPMGLELFMRCSTNYLSLKTIYHQRKNHRLKEWDIFCKWIESLPYAKELIINQN